MQSTEWRAIPGFEGTYEASDDGRIRNIAQGRNRRVNYELKPATLKWGHQQVCLRRVDSTEKAKTYLVHRLVALAFLGEPTGSEVRHLDGDPRNNNLDNLAFGSHADNMQDRLRHGNHNMARKEECPSGHAYAEDNTYRRPNTPTNRACRTCRKLEAAKRRVSG